MISYEEEKYKVLDILKKSNLNVAIFVTIAKKLCACGECVNYKVLYDEDGNKESFGICEHYKQKKIKNASNACCVNWRYRDE